MSILNGSGTLRTAKKETIYIWCLDSKIGAGIIGNSVRSAESQDQPRNTEGKGKMSGENRIGICQECEKVFHEHELTDDGHWGHMCKAKKTYTQEHRCESYIDKYAKENLMPDSKVEVKACLICNSKNIKLCLANINDEYIGWSKYKESKQAYYYECELGHQKGWGTKEEALKAWNTRSPIANNGVSLEEIEHIIDEWYLKTDEDGCINYSNLAQMIYAKLPTTAPRGGGELEVWCGCGDKLSKRNDGMYWCLGCNSGVEMKKGDSDV